MTAFPYSIDVSDSVRKAGAMMEEHKIHHLPVTDGAALIGVVSERDISIAEGFSDGTVDGKTLAVGTVCTRRPYVVDLHTPLREVASTMADRHLGSALVVRDGKLVGIVTHTDICRFLAGFLGQEFPDGEGGGEVA